MTALSAKIRLEPISNLLDKKFFIPSYQRGYRWTSHEVNDLLDDIYEFTKNNEIAEKSTFYCLQPLIVYPQNGKYYLIDGQQRLTTIYIILTCLKEIATILGKGKYVLEYETRPDSEKYLKVIDESSANDNVDYYHIHGAYKAVNDWFRDKDGILKMNMLKTITAPDEEGRNVKFIWYEIEPKDAIDVFTRINIGKIPLTNAELVKALFLREKNFKSNETAKQVFLASEWDDIERKLSNPSFWYFLTDLDMDSRYDNKIELLLDIVSKKGKESEKLHTFHFFNNLIESERKSTFEQREVFDIDQVWKMIKNQFSQLEEWYSDHTLYHYIGYLFHIQTSIQEVSKLAAGKSKKQFIKSVKDAIKAKTNGISLDELDFDKPKDKKNIRKVLLLFNIESLLQSNKADTRFPFDRYKNESWDIEHINPQNPFDKIEFYKNWCLDILEYLTGQKLQLSDILKNSEEYDECVEELMQNLHEEEKATVNQIIDILNDEIDYKPKVEDLSAKLFSLYRGVEAEETNHLSNLTLLDPQTNRGYGNALFPIKRNQIIENDMKGLFVPICTKNVFLKYYSKQFAEVMYWRKTDATAYFESLKGALSYYLN
ncbi:MAG: hypothetical protein K0S09_1326 [Sphingobacteriaceae bacterium]|jgi:uncharacterized protein with ParB-like and HNH nuclease domain|nr:hypothetical protein [Sphingobacteriaceae bacterium]